VVGNINPETGELKYTPERNWGYLYETLGEWQGGNLAWIHTQVGNNPSYYAIYFNSLDRATSRTLCRAPASSATAPSVWRKQPRIPTHSSSAVLTSPIGTAMACRTFWWGGAWRNHMVSQPRDEGTAKLPLREVDVLPQTASHWTQVSAPPVVIDWDGDGLQDLVCGAEWNRAVWYKNVGTNAEPKLVYKGFIYTDDGKPFQLPHDPIPEIKGV